MYVVNSSVYELMNVKQDQMIMYLFVLKLCNFGVIFVVNLFVLLVGLLFVVDGS